MADVETYTSQAWIQALLNSPILARIATANPLTLQPHVVPVWFEWDEGAIWISSFDSTRKMRDLEGNQRVSVVIDTAEDGSNVRGVLMEGTAEVIDDPAVVAPRSTSIYLRYLGEDGVQEPGPASWIIDPENRIIRMFPERIMSWGG